jgi:benzodiazapine receptor
MAAVNSVLLKWVNVIAFLAVVVVNALAGSTTIIGGQDTAQVSDKNFTLITPAGYTFAIWGIIYVLLGVFVVFQALPSNKGKIAGKIGWFFVLSSILNIAWLFLWQFEVLSLSVVLMFLLFASLLMIYLKLGVGKFPVSLREKLAVHAPLSVYFGWITIASIANVAAALVAVSWDGFGLSAETWGVLVIIVALLIASLVVLTRNDVAYGLVIIWALVGISANLGKNQNIVLAAQVSAAIVVAAVVATVLVAKFRPKRQVAQ